MTELLPFLLWAFISGQLHTAQFHTLEACEAAKAKAQSEKLNHVHTAYCFYRGKPQK